MFLSCTLNTSVISDNAKKTTFKKDFLVHVSPELQRDCLLANERQAANCHNVAHIAYYCVEPNAILPFDFTVCSEEL